MQRLTQPLMPRRPFEILLAAALLLTVWSLPGLAQDIYVTQDEQGNPVYSDRPRGDASAPIILRDSNIYEAQPIPEVEPRASHRRGQGNDDATVRYSVRITEPADEAAIRSPEGRVAVEVSVEPGLRSGHRLELLRNGEPVPGEGPGFSVQTYDRGASEFVARVMDGDRELARSEAVTVYLLRRGLLSPAPANPAPNFRPRSAP